MSPLEFADDLGAAMAAEKLRELESGALERRFNSSKAITDFMLRSVRGATEDMVMASFNMFDPRFSRYLTAAKGNSRTASTLYVLAEGTTTEIESTFGLDSEEAKAFVHYMNQTFKKNHLAIPVVPDWKTVWHESNGGFSDFMPGVNIPKALSGLAFNYDEIAKEFLDKKDQIEAILEEGNLVILSNHCTWLNLPILVAFLHEVLEIPLEKITTILGPALEVYLQAHAVSGGGGNTLLTIPDTPNGRLDNVAPTLQSSVRRSFGIKLFRLLKREIGNVILLCPNGTSDKYEDGQIHLLRPPEPTRQMVREHFEPHSHILPIATDTRTLFKWQIPRVGRMNMKVGEILPPSTKHQKPIQKLHKLVQDLNPDEEVIVMREERELETA